MAKKDMQTELDRLKKDLALAKADADYFRNLSGTTSQAITTLRESYQKELEAQKADHGKKLQMVISQATEALIRGDERNELRVLQAQHDTMQEAYSYLVDRVTAKQ